MINKEFTFSDENFKFLSRLIFDIAGIVISDNKKDMIYRRLTKRLRELKIYDFNDYCNLISDPRNSGEIENFTNFLTTNKTSFFRENHHFEFLAKKLQLINKNPPPNKKLRIWSAACSEGHEPYSIAMVMKENISNIESWDAKILATDIDTNILEKAKTAIYDMEWIKNIPDIYKKKYLTKNSKTNPTKFAISDDLKKYIKFNQLNLLNEWPIKGQFDFIFCRNVIIYFDKDTKVSLFKKFAKATKPNGFLFIGHSESLHNISDDYKLVDNTTYALKK